MNKTVQALIAAACVAVIAVAGLWLHDRSQTRAEAARIQAAAAQIVRAERIAEVQALQARLEAVHSAEVEACRQALEQYDTQGATLALVTRIQSRGDELTGDSLAAEAQACREVLAR